MAWKSRTRDPNHCAAPSAPVRALIAAGFSPTRDQPRHDAGGLDARSAAGRKKLIALPARCAMAFVRSSPAPRMPPRSPCKAPALLCSPRNFRPRPGDAAASILGGQPLGAVVRRRSAKLGREAVKRLVRVSASRR